MSHDLLAVVSFLSLQIEKRHFHYAVCAQLARPGILLTIA
jgi:hypothetical protein